MSQKTAPDPRSVIFHPSGCWSPPWLLPVPPRSPSLPARARAERGLAEGSPHGGRVCRKPLSPPLTNAQLLPCDGTRHVALTVSAASGGEPRLSSGSRPVGHRRGQRPPHSGLRPGAVQGQRPCWLLAGGLSPHQMTLATGLRKCPRGMAAGSPHAEERAGGSCNVFMT